MNTFVVGITELRNEVRVGHLRRFPSPFGTLERMFYCGALLFKLICHLSDVAGHFGSARVIPIKYHGEPMREKPQQTGALVVFGTATPSPFIALNPGLYTV